MAMGIRVIPNQLCWTQGAIETSNKNKGKGMKSIVWLAKQHKWLLLQ